MTERLKEFLQQKKWRQLKKDRLDRGCPCGGASSCGGDAFRWNGRTYIGK